MPAVIVFLAGVVVALVLFWLGAQLGTTLVVGAALGFLIQPLVLGIIRNW